MLQAIGVVVVVVVFGVILYKAFSGFKAKFGDKKIGGSYRDEY